MISCVLESPLSRTTTTPYTNKDQFWNASNLQAVTFLFLFAVSCLFSTGLFIINLYKTLKVTTEQKHFFQQASISTHREDVQKDLKMQIGKKVILSLPSTSNASLSSTPLTLSTITTANSLQSQSKKDRWRRYGNVRLMTVYSVRFRTDIHFLCTYALIIFFLYSPQLQLIQIKQHFLRHLKCLNDRCLECNSRRLSHVMQLMMVAIKTVLHCSSSALPLASTAAVMFKFNHKQAKMFTFSHCAMHCTLHRSTFCQQIETKLQVAPQSVTFQRTLVMDT